MHRPPQATGRTSWVPIPGRIATGSQLERAQQRRSRARQSAGRKESNAVSCPQLPFLQCKVETAHGGDQQNERHKLPGMRVESRETLQFAQQTPPGGKRFRHTQSEDSEIGLRENEHGTGNPELRVENRLQVGKNVSPQQTEAAAA